MYTYYPVPSDLNVNKGKRTEETDKLSAAFILEARGQLSGTGILMEV